MYNWNGKSNKEREVLFIQILLGRDTSTSSLAQYGEFIPVEGSSEPDDKLLYYKDIVESVEITSVLENNPNISDTEVINFTLDDSGYKISEIKEEYGVSPDNTSYASVSTWLPNAVGLTLNTTNRYLWNKSTITLSNGSSDSSYKIISSFIADSGSISVTELTEYYAISPYNTYSPELIFGQDVGKWSTELPIGFSIDNRYVWNYNVVRFDNSTTQGGYNNAMIIGDYGNQLREVKFVPNITESDYHIDSNGVIVSTDTWWESRGGLGQPVDWNHIKDITQIQINDVVIIRGIAQVVVPQPNNTSTTVNCTTLINAKVSQISDKINNEYTIRAATLNYVLENAEAVAADVSRLEAEIEAVEDEAENLKSQVIGLNLSATQALSDGILTREEQDSLRTQYDNIVHDYHDVQGTCNNLGWSISTSDTTKQYIPEYKDLNDAFNTLCSDYSIDFATVGLLKYIIDPKNASGTAEDIIGIKVDNEDLAILVNGEQQGKFVDNTRHVNSSSLLSAISNFYDKLLAFNNRLNEARDTEYDISPVMSELDLGMSIMNLTISNLGSTLDQAEYNSISNQLTRLNSIESSIVAKFNEDWSTNPNASNYVPEYADFISSYNTYKNSINAILSHLGQTIPSSDITAYTNASTNLTTDINDLEDYYISSTKSIQNLTNILDSDITNLATILNNTRGTLFNIFSDYVVDKSEQQSVRLQIASLKSLYDNVVSRATSLGWNVQSHQAYSYYNAVVKAYNALASNTYNYDNNSSHTIPSTDISTGLLTYLVNYSGTNTDTYFCETVLQYTADNTLINTEGTTQPISGSSNVAYKVYSAYVSKINAWLDNFISSCDTFDRYVDDYQILDSLLPQVRVRLNQTSFYVDNDGTLIDPLNGIITASLLLPTVSNPATFEVEVDALTNKGYSWSATDGVTPQTAGSNSTYDINLNNNSYYNSNNITVSCTVDLHYRSSSSNAWVSTRLNNLTAIITRDVSNARFEIQCDYDSYEINNRMRGDYKEIAAEIISIGYSLDFTSPSFIYTWTTSDTNVTKVAGTESPRSCVFRVPYTLQADRVTITYLTFTSGITGHDFEILNSDTVTYNTTNHTTTFTTNLDRLSNISQGDTVMIFERGDNLVTGEGVRGTVTNKTTSTMVDPSDPNNTIPTATIVINSSDKVSMYISSFTLTGINIPTISIYYGASAIDLTEPPAGFNSNKILPGDSYLKTSSPGAGLKYAVEDTTAPHGFRWENAMDLNIIGSGTPLRSKLLSESLYDALQHPTHELISANLGYFSGLSAVDAFVENIFANYIRLGRVLFSGTRELTIANSTATTDSNKIVRIDSVSQDRTTASFNGTNVIPNYTNLYILIDSDGIYRYWRYYEAIKPPNYEPLPNNNTTGFIMVAQSDESDLDESSTSKIQIDDWTDYSKIYNYDLSKFDFDPNTGILRAQIQPKVSSGFYINKGGEFNTASDCKIRGSIKSNALETNNNIASSTPYTSSIANKTAYYKPSDLISVLGLTPATNSIYSTSSAMPTRWTQSSGANYYSDLIDIEYRNSAPSSEYFINDRYTARGLSSFDRTYYINYYGTVYYSIMVPWLKNTIGGSLNDTTTVYIYHYNSLDGTTTTKLSQRGGSETYYSDNITVHRGDYIRIKWGSISDQWFATTSVNTWMTVRYSASLHRGLNFIRSNTYSDYISPARLNNQAYGYRSFNGTLSGTSISIDTSNTFSAAGLPPSGWTTGITPYALGQIPSLNGYIIDYTTNNISSCSITINGVTYTHNNSSSARRVTGLSGSSTSLIIYLANGSSITFSKSDYYTGYNISISLITDSISTITELLLPKTKYVDSDTGTDIGSEMHPTGTSTTYNYFKKVYAMQVHNAIWNDYVDKLVVNPDLNLIPGKCYIKSGDRYDISNKYCQKGTLGIHSDTYAHSVGNVPETTQLAISVSGYVLAYTDKRYDPGTPLTSGKNGVLTKMRWWSRMIHPERMVGTYLKDEPSDLWFDTVKVNGRNWIKVK